MFNGRIFVCADPHGSPIVFSNLINQIDSPTEEDVIIIAGDAGFEYQQNINGAAKRKSKKFPGYWVVLRGNHDSCYWAEHEDQWEILEGVNGADFLYQKKYPHILYVKDSGGIYKIGEYNFLMLPGAYSIDKFYRLSKQWPYNPNEQLSPQEMNELKDLVINWNRKNLPIDYVIAHTFPVFLEKQYRDLFLSFIDQSSVDRSTEEWLADMAMIFEKNPDFKCYFGGHMHDDRWLESKYRMVYHTLVEILD